MVDTITQEKIVFLSISEAARVIGYTKEGISLAFKRQKEKGVDFIFVKNKRYKMKKNILRGAGINFSDAPFLVSPFSSREANNTYYTLAASSKVSLNIIISYFNKYPLFSSKFLDYKYLERVAHLIINGQHLTDEGIQIVEFVRSRMNTKRTDFNWDHFKNLY